MQFLETPRDSVKFQFFLTTQFLPNCKECRRGRKDNNDAQLLSSPPENPSCKYIDHLPNTI